MDKIKKYNHLTKQANLFGLIIILLSLVSIVSGVFLFFSISPNTPQTPTQELYGNISGIIYISQAILSLLMAALYLKRILSRRKLLIEIINRDRASRSSTKKVNYFIAIVALVRLVFVLGIAGVVIIGIAIPAWV